MLQTLRAEMPAYGGYVIGRNGKVIFIKGAVPGELVEVSIDEAKKDYSIATVKNILEPSPFRREPVCRLFGICGGCHLQFITPEKQTEIKEEILLDALKRISGSEIPLSASLTDTEFRYRRRGQFKVSQDGRPGFYRQGTREVVPVEECPVMADEINQALRKLQNIDLRGVKELHLIAGDTVAALIKGTLSEESAGRMMGEVVSGIAFENGESMGRDYITLDLAGLRYSVTPWSFFQSHWPLNNKVVEFTLERLAPLEGKKVLDLYSGAGNFSLPLSTLAKEVVAVEENPFAVEDGRRNAAQNKIKNCTFIRTALEDTIKQDKKNRAAARFWEAGYDIVIADPPRAGFTTDCLKKLLSVRPQRIVYISCNPAIMARDLKKMKDVYDIEAVHMADFFPNTYHIEALAFLKLK